MLEALECLAEKLAGPSSANTPSFSPRRVPASTLNATGQSRVTSAAARALKSSLWPTAGGNGGLKSVPKTALAGPRDPPCPGDGKFTITLPQSRYLYAVAEPYGVLLPGEVLLQSGGALREHVGDVLAR